MGHRVQGFVNAFVRRLSAEAGGSSEAGGLREVGRDWIDWYLYERDSLSGEINQAWDKDGTPICYDIPSLWKEVEELRVSEDFKEYELPKRMSEGGLIDFEKLIGKFFKF